MTPQGYFLVAGLASYTVLGLWRPPPITDLVVSLPAILIAIVVAGPVTRRLDAARFFRLVFAALLVIRAALLDQRFARSLRGALKQADLLCREHVGLLHLRRLCE